MTFPENFIFPGFPDPVGTLLLIHSATCKKPPNDIHLQEKQ